AAWRFKMVDRIRAACARHIARIQQSQAKISLLAHVEKMFAISPHGQKQVSTHCMSCAHKRRNDVRFPTMLNGLPQCLVLPYVLERNRDSRNPGMVEFRQRLLNDPWR